MVVQRAMSRTAAGNHLPAPRGRMRPTRQAAIRIRAARSLPEKTVFDKHPRADVPKMAQAEPVLEEPQQSAREAMASISAAPSRDPNKDSPARGSSSAGEAMDEFGEKVARTSAGVRPARFLHRRMKVTISLLL